MIGARIYVNVAHGGIGHDATNPSLISMGHEPGYDLLFAVPLAGKKVDGAPVCVLRQRCGAGDGHLHIVADNARAASARRHRAAVGIGQRDLLIGRGAPSEGLHVLQDGHHMVVMIPPPTMVMPPPAMMMAIVMNLIDDARGLRRRQFAGSGGRLRRTDGGKAGESADRQR